MRLYLTGLTALLLLSGCGSSPNATLAPKLSQYTTAQQQCSDYLDGKNELTNDIEKECAQFLKRLEMANKTAEQLNSGKLKKGEYDQKKTLYARERNKVKQTYTTLSLSVKDATLSAIKSDNTKMFENGVAFPGNRYIKPYYEYMKVKAPLFDTNVNYITYQRKASKKLMTSAQYTLKQGKKKKALALFVKAAKMGNPEAARSAGLLYEESDNKQALHWHTIAVDGGVVSSYLNLGRLYEAQGERETALTWYLKATENNDKQAQFQLYHYYVKNDQTKAVNYLALSAKNGYNEAQYTYALLLIKEGNSDKAIDLLQQASQNNYTPASEYLGNYYYELKLYERAFKQLSQTKSANSFYLQAKMYEEGAGVSRDYSRAFTLYTRANALGKTDAQKDVQRVNALLDSEQQRIAQEQEKIRIAQMEKMIKECGDIPTADNIKLKAKKVHIIGIASAPVGNSSFVIYGDDGEDYYIIKTRGIQEGKRVDISAMSKGSTATLTDSEGDGYEVYQLIYDKKCIIEEEQ